MALTSVELCRRYSLADIQLATQNFDDGLVIGKGGFGKVYKGNIKIGEGSSTVVAIKRLGSTSKQGAPEFRAEIEMLSKLRHSHLVSLLGWCDEGKEMILVYEYMPYGSLHHYLHESSNPLSWMQRLKISIGAARGLDYLHTGAGTKDGVIHRDVKTSNILLDEDWEAKISDFGLAKICKTNQPSTYVNTRVKGTFGYLDPHSVFTGKVTRKTDVFAFGVVLFELLSRRLAVFPDEDEDLNLASWAQDCMNKRNLDQVVEAEIRVQLSPKSSKVFAKMAYRCVCMDPKQRPTMSEVVVALQLSLALQEKFNNSAKPSGLIGFSWKMPSYFVLPTKENSAEDVCIAEEDLEVHLGQLKTKDKRRKERFFKRNGGLLLKQQESAYEYLVDKTTLFTAKELEKATDYFNEDRLLDRGGQGTVYKGMLKDGRIVAVKKLKIVEKSQLEEYMNEVEILLRVNHRNVVKLLGCCLETKVPLLVFEFISNGTLFEHIHNVSNDFPLTLNTRLQIATEVAGALAYLHSFDITHRDIKSRSILLDEKYKAKVSGFGTSRFMPTNETHVSTLVKGTFGYLDPEYFLSSQLTEKSDVYSFGVVLVELLTGEKPIYQTRFGEHRSLASYFWSAMEEGQVMSVIDARIVKEGSGDELMAVANLAMQCLKLNGKNRPTMKEVASKLEGIRTAHVPSTVQTDFRISMYNAGEEELIMLSYDDSTSTVSLL